MKLYVLGLLSFLSTQSFADIVVFDNTRCSSPLVRPTVFYYSTWLFSPSEVHAKQKLVVDTGEHFKRGEKFIVSYLGTTGPSCDFVANGGTHYFITKDDWLPHYCDITKCVSENPIVE